MTYGYQTPNLEQRVRNHEMNDAQKAIQTEGIHGDVVNSFRFDGRNGTTHIFVLDDNGVGRLVTVCDSVSGQLRVHLNIEI